MSSFVTDAKFGVGAVLELRQAARRLRREPGFTLAAVATLALGIGGTTAIYSVVHGIVLSALPHPDADELVWLDHAAPGLSATARLSMAEGLYQHYSRRARSLSSIAVWSDFEATLTGDGADPARVTTTQVTHTLGAVLRLQPLYGRWFVESDSYAGGQSVVVLSYALWQSRYGADPRVIGRTVWVNDFPLEVVGIMPRSFTFPSESMHSAGRGATDTQLWIPRVVPDAAGLDFTVLGVARLAPGASVADAEAELNASLSFLEEVLPTDAATIDRLRGEAGLVALVVPLKEQVIGSVQQMLWILLGTVSFVLLIACSNVANLFLVRAETRNREVAVRRALGANRGRLVGYFLGESLLLSTAGVVFGVGLALVAVRTLVRFGPDTLPRLSTIEVSPSALALAVMTAVVATLVFAAIPFFGGGDLPPDSLAMDRVAGANRIRMRMRHALVTSQIALALVLLIGSGLMIQSFWHLTSVDPGFDPSDDVLTFEVGLPRARYQTVEAVADFYEQIEEQLSGLPGVQAVGAVSCLPLQGWCGGSQLLVADREASPTRPVVALRRATERYFEASGIDLVRGRTFERSDYQGGAAATVISEALADLYFPGEDPIGQRVFLGDTPPSEAGWFTVVGVVEDVPAVTLTKIDDPLIYFPAFGSARGVSPWSMTFVLRAARARGLVPSARRVVASLDDLLPISSVRTLGGLAGEASAQMAFTMVLLAIAALVALLLGMIGTYGVIAYVVQQRRREIGVRMALGAHPTAVLGMILWQGARVVAVGLLIGLVGAAALSRLMDSLLFGVTPTDPRTWVTVSALLFFAAVTAIQLPARRAAGLDPVETLR